MPATLVSALRDALVLSILLAAAAGAPAYGAGPPSTSPPTVEGTAEVGETLTVSTGTWGVEHPLQYAYQWQRCIGAPYAPEVLADAPTAYYRLGDEAESPGVTDATGNENTGVFRNGVLREVDGGPLEDTDGAAGFDGVDDLVEIPDAAGLDLGDAFTLEAWVRPDALRPGQLFDKGPNGYALRITGDGTIVLSKSGAGTIAASGAIVPLDGAFHHVVATKSGASPRVYLDGADVTGAVSNRTVADTASPLLLGAAHGAPAGEEPFAGELDEVALYRGALSAARVRAHYDAGSSGCVSVPGAVQPSYTPVAADYGGAVRALVTASDASGATTAASAETLPVGTRVPVSVDRPVAWGEAVAGEALRAGEGRWAGDEPLEHSFQWQGCLDRRYRATVLADGPNGYWRLGELSGTTAADHSGKGNKGTYVNGVKLGVPGALLGSGDGNRAARFDGVNDFVTVPDRSSLDLGDSLTIEEWVRRNAAGVRGQIVQKGVGGYALRVNADGRVHFAKSDVGDLAVSTTTIPVDGAFRHVVATKNGAAIRIYVDGEDVTSVVANRTLVNTSAPLQIGRFYNPGTGTTANYFNGDLDEVAVYGHALSAARVRAHYEMGTSGCTDLPGATAASYTPGDAQAGQRLRVVVTARNDAGAASAVSEQTQAPVSQGGNPVIASGTLTDAGGNPVAGAAVALYLWPSAAGEVTANEPAETLLVAETTTDAGGGYALRAPLTPEIRAEADLNGGVVNLEVRASADGLLYETFLERDFGSPDADSLALGGDDLAGAAALWQDGSTALPAAPLRIALAADEPAVTALAADPPGQGVECSDWDKTFRIWKRTGQGEAWTRVGELHTWSAMTNRFAYGARADSTIEIAFKKPGSKWFVNGSIHVGNSSGQGTAAEVQATTGVGEYTSRAVRARFVYTHWYQCGTGNKKSRAARWNGYSLGKGVRVSTRDGECSELKAWIFEPGQAWERNRNRAIHWGVAVDLGFFMVGARSGYSTWVRSKWFFGSTLASRTLCGVNKYPGDAPRVFAGW